MKTLILGGAYQGKRIYAVEEYGLSPVDIAPADAPLEELFSYKCIDGLHRIVARLLEQGEDAESYVLSRLAKRESWIILCDEVGCGVVPVDREERRWREAVGRLCCRLAAEAHRVERVYCGLPQRLKGE